MSDESFNRNWCEAEEAARDLAKFIEHQATRNIALQRENEELRRIASEKHDEVLALEAATITPEMRGRIIKMAEIDDAEWDNFLVENGYPPSVKPAVTQLISDLRDLLGEQG